MSTRRADTRARRYGYGDEAGRVMRTSRAVTVSRATARPREHAA